MSWRVQRIDELTEVLCEKIAETAREHIAELAIKYDWTVDARDPERIYYAPPCFSEIKESEVHSSAVEEALSLSQSTVNK